MNRVFICGAFNFPRGGAASNYVQYFGMALKECKYEVHVVTTKNAEYNELNYKGLIIDEIKYRQGRIKHYMDFKTGAKKSTLECLIQKQVVKDDIVLVYSHNLWLHRGVLSFCRKKGIKVGAIVVEYFSKEQFSGKYEYWKYNKLMKTIMPNYDFLLPISTYIEEKLSGGKAKQLVLPIMADPYEYEYKVKSVSGTRKFIFPAKGKMKDALENMVRAIGEVLKNPVTDVEFHFCGVKEADIRRILKMADVDALDKRIVIHGWMEYDELVKLYQQMHFLILARDISEMTKANFPSKVPELMCYGVVPIVSRVGDYTKYYLVNDGNSIIMDGCSKEVIKEAIERCLLMSCESINNMSQYARVTAEEAFWYMNWAEKIGSFIRSV